jgi:hypothetical protein
VTKGGERNVEQQILSDCEGFEVHARVIVKSSIFWDIMPCSSSKVN